MSKRMLMAFVVANLVLGASQARANFDQDTCLNPQGGTKPCCPSCWIWCDCSNPGET